MSGEHRGLFTIDASGYQAREPEVRVEQLGAGVWTAAADDYRTLFFEGSEGVVAVNTLGSPGAARAYRAAIDSAVPGRRITTLVCTNDHVDHTGYAGDLAPDAEIVAHELTARVIEGRAADGQLPPTRTVAAAGEDVELDGVRVQLRYPGPTVGTGNLAVGLPEHGILFMIGPRSDARYGLFPDFHMRHYARNVRSLLDGGFDRFVPGRSEPMAPADVAAACDYFEALHDASQRAFAEGVPIWEYDAMEQYVAAALRPRFGALPGFERHVGIGAVRVVHHYLMGGWGLEDTVEPERLGRDAAGT